MTVPFYAPVARRSVPAVVQRNSARLAGAVIMLFVALFAAACENSGFDPDAETGMVRVVVSGLASGSISAGTAVISSSETGPINMSLPAAITIDTVPVGTYQVIYTPPGGYNLAAGQSSAFVVTVTTGELTSIALTVVQANGALDVAVTGLGAGAGSGGSASVLRTDIAGQTPVNMNIGAAGTSSINLIPGDYTVTYVAPTGYQLRSGQTSTRPANIRSNARARAEYEVEPIPQPTGSLQINVTGFASGVSSRGSASVLRTDIAGQAPVTVSIGSTGTASTSLTPGTYSVTYTPPSGYQLTQGQTNPQTVNVIASTTAPAGYQVELVPVQTGTLRITVSGLPAGTTNGGTAAVLRTDIAGQTATNVNLTAGATSVSRVPGTYRVTFQPPTGYTLASGQNPQTVTVAESQTSDAAFGVTAATPPPPPPPPPPGGSVLFSSDFSAALGQTDAAVSDGGRWSQLIGNGQANEVVSSAGLDFPTPNVLAARAQLPTSSGGSPTELVRTTSLPSIAVGDRRGYRAYLRVMTPDAFDASPGADSHTHPIQDGNAAGDSNWMLQVFTDGGGAGQWLLRFSTPVGPFAAPVLSKNVTYRIEWLIERSAAGYAFHARVYNSAGALLYDNDDFNHLWSDGTLAGAASMAFGDPTTGLNAGHNGVGSVGPSNLYPFTLYYQGAIAVCVDWCGAR